LTLVELESEAPHSKVSESVGAFTVARTTTPPARLIVFGADIIPHVFERFSSDGCNSSDATVRPTATAERQRQTIRLSFHDQSPFQCLGRGFTLGEVKPLASDCYGIVGI
jgi:hypothetical protein